MAAADEKMPDIEPHPRGLHLWWARRSLAAARLPEESYELDPRDDAANILMRPIDEGYNP